ncbi:MAG: MBL fold metallo-hydrolase [Neomegalonema sp.]
MVSKLVICTALFLSAGAAQASDCLGFAQRDLPGWTVFTLDAAQLGERDVAISFVGHSSYRIEAPDGTTIITDYSGWSGPGDQPEVVTMNRAHETHYTDYPDPRIEHVLRGWNPENTDGSGDPAEHYATIGETLIRNVATSVQSYDGVRPNDNSIFIFEIQGLCIGHLGHLHFEPNDEQFGAIGFLDVVMVPVDGTYTMSQVGMMEVLKKLRAKVILPMHWFGQTTLNAFLRIAAEEFDVRPFDENWLVLSKETLPEEAVVVVMQPNFREEFE